MAKTIVFKKEFEDKLKKLKIKTKFVRNFKDPKWIYSDMVEFYSQQFEKAPDWIRFMEYAFQWCNTLEGEKYWQNISNS